MSGSNTNDKFMIADIRASELQSDKPMHPTTADMLPSDKVEENRTL
jgi:hypothetical protein